MFYEYSRRKSHKHCQNYYHSLKIAETQVPQQMGVPGGLFKKGFIYVSAFKGNLRYNECRQICRIFWRSIWIFEYTNIEPVVLR